MTSRLSTVVACPFPQPQPLCPGNLPPPRSHFNELLEPAALPLPTSAPKNNSQAGRWACEKCKTPGHLSQDHLATGPGPWHSCSETQGRPQEAGLRVEMVRAYLVRVGVASSRVEALWAPLTSWPCEGMTRERVTLVLLVLWALE